MQQVRWLRRPAFLSCGALEFNVGGGWDVASCWIKTVVQRMVRMKRMLWWEWDGLDHLWWMDNKARTANNRFPKPKHVCSTSTSSNAKTEKVYSYHA
jgi:hypothetical protein